MLLALIGDLHWGVRNDSLEFLEHFDRFFDEVFFPEVKARGITHIIQLGDFVDRRKFISYVTLNRMRRFLMRCREEGLEIDILIGNHDTPYKNSNEINSMRELLGDNPMDHVRFYWEPTELEFDGCQIAMIPWINQSNYQQTLDLIKKTKAQVLFGHLEIKGFEMYRGMPSHEGFDTDMFSKFEFVGSGHFHHRSTHGNIHYLGTPYEMTWSDYGDTKGFHVFDTSTREAEFIRNPLSMFHKVWYDDEGKENDEILNKKIDHLSKSYVKLIVSNKTNPYLFDLYLGKIYEKGPLDVTIVEDHRNMTEISEEDLANEAEDTLTILSKYVENLESSVDKKALDAMMRSLYNEAEAVNMESE